MMSTVLLLVATLAIAKYVFEDRGFLERLTAGGAAGATGIWVITKLLFYLVEDRSDLPDKFVEPAGLFAWTLTGALVGGCVVFLGLVVARAPAWLRGTRDLVEGASDAAREYSANKEAWNDAVYRRIADELAEQKVDPATWVQAYERARGDERKAKAEYIRLRKRQLLSNAR